MSEILPVILAGGDSSRFWPLSDKVLLQLYDKPLLYYRLLQLKKFGFQDPVVICNKQNKNSFIQFDQTFKEFGITLVEQTNPKGMAGALLSAKKLIEGKKILVIKPVDVVEDILFHNLVQILKSNPKNLLTGLKTETYFPGGYLTITDGMVTHIVEKPVEGTQPSDMVRIVVDYFSDASLFLTYLEKAKSKHDDEYEVALEAMLSHNIPFHFLAYDGFWGALQYPWHVLPIMSNFLQNTKRHFGRNISVSKTAVITGNVYIDDGARILENTKIVGPSYIGKNTLVGNNSVVRESIIGSNCVLGYSTEITRSYIGNSCWFHSNFVGDSVISNNVSMGAGAVLANYRLDEGTISSNQDNKRIDTKRLKLGAIIGENVRLGVNCSIMPGVKIGSGSFVGSSVMLDQDIAENKACFHKPNYEIRQNTKSVNSASRKTLQNSIKV